MITTISEGSVDIRAYGETDQLRVEEIKIAWLTNSLSRPKSASWRIAGDYEMEAVIEMVLRQYRLEPIKKEEAEKTMRQREFERAIQILDWLCMFGKIKIARMATEEALRGG